MDATEAVLRRKFLAMQSYLRKQERSQINNLTLHLKGLDKEGEKNTKLADKRNHKDQSRNRDKESNRKDQ